MLSVRQNATFLHAMGVIRWERRDRAALAALRYAVYHFSSQAQGSLTYRVFTAFSASDFELNDRARFLLGDIAQALLLELELELVSVDALTALDTLTQDHRPYICFGRDLARLLKHQLGTSAEAVFASLDDLVAHPERKRELWEQLKRFAC